MVQLQRLSGGLFETNSHGTSGSQAEVAQADTDHYRLNDSRYLSHPDDPELLGQYQPDEPEPESAEPHLSFSTDEIHKYFWVEGNWRYLAGISLCGFFLHTAFAVLGTYDYRVIFQIWDSATPPSNSTSLPAYSNGQSVSLVPGTEIYNVLSNSATNSLITVSVPLVVGSMLALIMVDHIPRRKALAWTSLVFALLLIVAGIVIIRDSKTSRSLVITLYVLLQFVFNFGE
jgi:PHS family inorganic phosphate transporter-like MFS transporter